MLDAQPCFDNCESVDDAARLLEAGRVERLRVWRREYRLKNLEKLRRQQRECKARAYARLPKRPRKPKKGWYFLKYGITLAQRDELLAAQGYACAVCQSDTPGTEKGWHTDHDHKTGKVRGLLCHRCNYLLGVALDDQDRLLAAAHYLEGTRI